VGQSHNSPWIQSNQDVVQVAVINVQPVAPSSFI
jgi:hypothetical protein